MISIVVNRVNQQQWEYDGDLVGGLEHLDYFPYIGNFIIPTDELIFFRGVGIPPTSYPRLVSG